MASSLSKMAMAFKLKPTASFVLNSFRGNRAIKKSFLNTCNWSLFNWLSNLFNAFQSFSVGFSNTFLTVSSIPNVFR